MDPAIIAPDEDNCITLTVHNLLSDTVKIGQELGGLWEVEEYNPSEEEQADIVHAVKTGAPSPAGKDRRTSDILNSISTDKSSLSVVQRNQVENLVSRFHHLFAISPSELGHTNLVEHSINTGDHPPIKQPVRRLPFALRHTVEDMVKDNGKPASGMGRRSE